MNSADIVFETTPVEQVERKDREMEKNL